jgi:hypothetical protein
MADSDSDVQFEDEWEEVPGPQAPNAAVAADTGDIYINLNGAQSKQLFICCKRCILIH